jgi:hypothetical protein
MSQRRAERTDELFPHVWSYRQAERTDEQLFPHARIQLSGDERREEAALTFAAESHMFTRKSEFEISNIHAPPRSIILATCFILKYLSRLIFYINFDYLF